MKTMLLILISFFPPDTTQYQQVMLQNIEAIKTAETPADLQNLSNTFKRIAAVENSEWEPLYYAALCNILAATREEEKSVKDAQLDEAMQTVEDAFSRTEPNAELFALEGFVHMIRVTVDPANRGQAYGSKAMESYHQALELEPENPRALLLAGQMEMGTARFLGSDMAPACEKLSRAVKIFETEPQKELLSPRWGKNHAINAQKNCK